MSDAPPAVASRLTAAQVGTLARVEAMACTDGAAWMPQRVVATEPGRTLEVWRAEPCDGWGGLNLLVDEGPAGALAVTVLLPGHTALPPKVQATASAALLGRLPAPGCDERRIVDTRPAARSVGELWTAEACGTRHRYRVDLDPDATFTLTRLDDERSPPLSR